VLEGEADFRVRDESRHVGAGHFIFVPRNAPLGASCRDDACTLERASRTSSAAIVFDRGCEGRRRGAHRRFHARAALRSSARHTGRVHEALLPMDRAPAGQPACPPHCLSIKQGQAERVCRPDRRIDFSSVVRGAGQPPWQAAPKVESLLARVGASHKRCVPRRGRRGLRSPRQPLCTRAPLRPSLATR
jgi:hypothetical protein